MMENMISRPNNTLLEVMQIINENSLGVCFVVDNQSVLLGVLTDGDIRRALLDNKSLNTSAGDILSNNFIFGQVGDSSSDLFDKFNKDPEKNINIIPIVDKDNKLVDYFKYSNDVHFPVAVPNLGGNEFKYLTDAFLSTWISSSGSTSIASDCRPRRELMTPVPARSLLVKINPVRPRLLWLCAV